MLWFWSVTKNSTHLNSFKLIKKEKVSHWLVRSILWYSISHKVLTKVKPCILEIDKKKDKVRSETLSGVNVVICVESFINGKRMRKVEWMMRSCVRSEIIAVISLDIRTWDFIRVEPKTSSHRLILSWWMLFLWR